MRNLYYIFILFIFCGCISEIEPVFDEVISNGLYPIAFSLDNVGCQSRCKQQDGDMVLAEDNDFMSISMEQEEWYSKDAARPEVKTSWTNSTNNTTWTAGDKIGIFMRDAVGGNSYSRNNVLYKVETGGGETASLTPDTQSLYFPDKTSGIKFYAYYPYSASSNSLVINYELPEDQSSVEALGNADIMYASTGSYTGATRDVALNFNHQMTLLTFNIKGGVLSGLFTLTEVTVSGSAITNKGTLDLTTGILTPNTSSTFTATVNTDQPTSSSDVATVDVIINPCTISNNSALLPRQLKVTLLFTGLLPHSTNLVTNGTFSKGTRYIYNITVAL